MNEPKLGDPIPVDQIEKAKAELKSGFRIIKVKRGDEELELHLFKPTIKTETIASDKYAEAYNKYLKMGLLLEEEMLEVLKGKSVWGEIQNKQIEEYRERMKDLEFSIADMRSKPNVNKASYAKLRKQWLDVRTSLESLIQKKNTYLSNTVEGRSSEEQLKCKLSLCVKYGDGRYLWDSLEALQNETDQQFVFSVTKEFLLFTYGLSQEIIDNLPNELAELIGEAIKSEK